jgi:hypothetical protein
LSRWSNHHTRGMRYALPVLCSLVALVLPACSESRPPEAPVVQVDDFQVLRTYGWDSTVADPQPSWNPETYQVLARSAGGFVLLDEGRGRQQYFGAKDKRDTAHPVWINRLQFAFGPQQNVIHTDDGRLVPNSEGLTVVSLQESSSGKDYAMSSQNLTNSGSSPKVWLKDLVAQYEDRIMLIDPFGKLSEFGPGFNAVPQRQGPGICWTDHPIFDTDYWSGSETKLGKMFIRWKPGITTEMPNAVEASWCANGGLLVTVLEHEPLAGQPWWRGGSSVWYIGGPKVAPIQVAAHVHGPAAHPNQALFAATDNLTSAAVLCSQDGRDRHEIFEHGEHMAWSYDGLRLLSDDPNPTNKDLRYIKIYLMRVSKPLVRTQP